MSLPSLPLTILEARAQRFDVPSASDRPTFAAAHHLLAEDRFLQSAFRDIAAYFTERLEDIGHDIYIAQETVMEMREGSH